MFLSLPAHVKRKNFIICDEASELEDEIIKQFSALIDPDRLKKYGVNSGSLYSTKNEAVLKWLYNTIVEISEHVTKLTNVNNKKIIIL
jgi:Rad3-related DNA helicase